EGSAPDFAPAGPAGKAIMVLSDDSVRPSDQAKLGNYLMKKRFVAAMGREVFYSTDATFDTDTYYNKTCVTLAGSPPVPVSACASVVDSIRAVIGSLPAFEARYGLTEGGTGSGEIIAKYYNRGDLGIGRNMHCRDTGSEVACFVKNYFPTSSFSPSDVGGFGGPSSGAFFRMDINAP